MISVQCPSCKRLHLLPESVLGKKAQCNACQHVFVVTHDAGLVEVGAVGRRPTQGPARSPQRAGQARLPGPRSPSKGKKLLLIGIPVGLLLVAGVVAAIMLGPWLTGAARIQVKPFMKPGTYIVTIKDAISNEFDGRPAQGRSESETVGEMTVLPPDAIGQKYVLSIKAKRITSILLNGERTTSEIAPEESAEMIIDAKGDVTVRDLKIPENVLAGSPPGRYLRYNVGNKFLPHLLCMTDQPVAVGNRWEDKYDKLKIKLANLTADTAEFELDLTTAEKDPPGTASYKLDLRYDRHLQAVTYMLSVRHTERIQPDGTKMVHNGRMELTLTASKQESGPGAPVGSQQPAGKELLITDTLKGSSPDPRKPTGKPPRAPASMSPPTARSPTRQELPIEKGPKIDRDDRVAQIVSSLDSGNIDTAWTALDSFRRTYRSDAEINRLEDRLIKGISAQTDALLRGRQYTQALALLNRAVALSLSTADATSFAAIARQTGQALLKQPDSQGQASEAFDLALKWNTGLLNDAGFAFDRLTARGASASVDDLSAFLGSFPKDPRVPQVRRALLCVAAGHMGDPQHQPTEQEIKLLDAACAAAQVNEVDAAIQVKARTLRDACYLLTLQAAEPGADPMPVLRVMDRLYAVTAPPTPAVLPEAGLPSDLRITPSALAPAIKAGREWLKWGVSLGDALDHQEVKMTLALAPLVIRDAPSAAAAIQELDRIPGPDHPVRNLVIVECPKSAVTAEQIERLRRWVNSGGNVWLLNSDVAGVWSFPDLGKDAPAAKVDLIPAIPRNGAAAWERAVVEQLPPSMGPYARSAGYPYLQLPPVNYTPVLVAADTDRRVYTSIVGVRLAGKGKAVFFFVAGFERSNAGFSRMIFNLKRLAVGAG